VRPIIPEPPPVNGSPPSASAQGSGGTSPALPPGVDRGATAVSRESLTSEAYVAVELPISERDRALQESAVDNEGYVPIGPLVAPPPTQFPRRHYFVVGVSPRGRKSDPSAPVSVPLEAVASAPGAPKVAHDEKAITITWTPSPDARSSTWLVPPPTGSAVAAAGREGGPTNVTPKTIKPAGPAPLTAKSLGFNTEATLYHVYDVSTNASPANPSDPYAIVMPAPVTPAPVAVTEWVIPSVAFGVERCFEVRPVGKVGDALVIGPASPQTCVTPADKFAPAAPLNLAAIAGSGSINLIWDANTEADIAGYLILRAEAPNATLQPITQDPVAAAAHRDETVKPGVRYVYSVVAVDRAGNRSVESNRVEETAR
jgi:hypothetical protein